MCRIGRGWVVGKKGGSGGRERRGGWCVMCLLCSPLLLSGPGLSHGPVCGVLCHLHGAGLKRLNGQPDTHYLVERAVQPGRSVVFEGGGEHWEELCHLIWHGDLWDQTSPDTLITITHTKHTYHPLPYVINSLINIVSSFLNPLHYIYHLSVTFARS